MNEAVSIVIHTYHPVGWTFTVMSLPSSARLTQFAKFYLQMYLFEEETGLVVVRHVFAYLGTAESSFYTIGCEERYCVVTCGLPPSTDLFSVTLETCFWYRNKW